MTKCLVCDANLPQEPRRGRPALYCGREHRKFAMMLRKLPDRSASRLARVVIGAGLQGGNLAV